MPQRLDQALVAANLADSRARAQALVKAGVVLVDGAPARKASQTVSQTATLSLTEDPCPWVSRAALKLVHALDLWNLTPHGEALDVGASTGGFTEVLRARGAARVHALDVGHGQLHPRVAADPQVRNLEGINARDIPEGLIPPVDWVVSDVSFISLEKALPGPLSLAKPGAQLVALIKPQFEVGREEVGKGGVVRDPALHGRVCDEVREWLETSGWNVDGIVVAVKNVNGVCPPEQYGTSNAALNEPVDLDDPDPFEAIQVSIQELVKDDYVTEAGNITTPVAPEPNSNQISVVAFDDNDLISLDLCYFFKNGLCCGMELCSWFLAEEEEYFPGIF